MMRVFLTGCAGFIGFHLSRRLLEQGAQVHGFDGVTDYYDPALKRARLDILRGFDGFSMTEAMLEDQPALMRAVRDSAPEIIVHLAAQVGVRHSLENPRSYLESNVTGSFNLLEAARENHVRHLLLASSSSVYGANAELPCMETDKSDRPLSYYAATKVSVESMAHAYAHLHVIPTTVFRFLDLP
ncbi:MAG: GDP-mannose 4,6-dehydratase [Thalassovita sp.]|nr:GDP-mannose 4,6-dehydratase [Thalassovita sp.]